MLVTRPDESAWPTVAVHSPIGKARPIYSISPFSETRRLNWFSPRKTVLNGRQSALEGDGRRGAGDEENEWSGGGNAWQASEAGIDALSVPKQPAIRQINRRSLLRLRQIMTASMIDVVTFHRNVIEGSGKEKHRPSLKGVRERVPRREGDRRISRQRPKPVPIAGKKRGRERGSRSIDSGKAQIRLRSSRSAGCWCRRLCARRGPV